MKRLLFFVNPNAGHTEIRSSLMQVIQIFTAGGYEVTVHPTAGPRDLTRQIVERGADYDLIVCTGGDGTLNEATSGLMQLERRPPLGYIPGGTVNDVASSLGLSRDPIVAAQDIVHGKPFAIDIGAFGENRWFDYVAAAKAAENRRSSRLGIKSPAPARLRDRLGLRRNRVCFRADPSPLR